MDAIDYPELVRAALLGMVRQLLGRVAEEGLPGEHHYYIGFRTDAPGVELPGSLRQRHPREMTIVLQHQFWGLEVSDSGFSVTLRFSGAPTRLAVPWQALTSFADPSVPCGQQLAPVAAPETAGPATATAGAEPPASDERPSEASASEEAGPPGNVVAFRRRPPAE